MSDATNMEQQAHQSGEHESPIWIAVLLIGMVALTVLGTLMSAAPGSKPIWISLLGVIVTLGIFSILYKENPFFRFLEHVFVGLSTGFVLVSTWQQILLPLWYTPLMPNSAAIGEVPHGQWWIWFALLLSLLFYTVYFPKLSWMNRLLVGVIMGWSAGYAFQEFVSLVGKQVTTSFKPPITTYGEATQGMGVLNNLRLGDPATQALQTGLFALIILLATGALIYRYIGRLVAPIQENERLRPAQRGLYAAGIGIAVLMVYFALVFGLAHGISTSVTMIMPSKWTVYVHVFSLLFMVILFCTMAYFFFSVEHRSKWISKPAAAGRYFIMITLGAIFGTTVMGRITLLIGRLDFLLTTFGDWGTKLAELWKYLMHH